MSNLSAIIEFIQNLCLENVEMNNKFKEINELNRESTKLENQLEELDREHVHLQIEFYNLETIISHNDISVMENFHQTSKKMYTDSVELKNLIEKIDFTKILQCYHMEMEAKCRNEWQPIQDCFVRTLQWHKQMEQRHIVQQYHQAELDCRQAEDAHKNQLESIEKSFKQTLELIKLAEERRNELIVVLIKASKLINDYEAKMKKLIQYQLYIEGLREEKLKIRSQLEQTHLKVFNPILSCNHQLTTKLKPDNEAYNFIMPKLPSFTDILKSFNRTENVTNFCVTSILHTSNSKQSITTKQTKNVRFKVQLEEYQDGMASNVYNSEIESETDIEIEVQPSQVAMEINEYQEEKENLQEMKDLENNSEIETVDLLTPANSLMETVKENKDVMDSSDYNANTKNQIDKKPLIEIQDCVIFKTPFPIQEVPNIQDKENVSNGITFDCSKQSSDTYCSNSSHTDIQKILNTTKKTFYEDFFNNSSSGGASPIMQSQSYDNTSTKPTALKDFESFFNDNKDFLFSSKERNEEIKLNETNNYATSTTATADAQDVLDFGCNKGFTFDSDDNIADNNNAGNMDFM